MHIGRKLFYKNTSIKFSSLLICKYPKFFSNKIQVEVTDSCVNVSKILIFHNRR